MQLDELVLPRPDLRPRTPARLADHARPRRPGQGREPPVAPARLPDRRAPLRHRQRPLSPNARQPDDLQLRLLAQRRHARRRPGSQVDADRQQARASKPACACSTSGAGGAAPPSSSPRSSDARWSASPCRASRRRSPASAAPGCRSRSASRTTASSNEPFDRVYSIGMFEHVGVKNYATYMEVVRRCLSRPRRALAAAHDRRPALAPARPTRGSRSTSSPTRCCRRWRRSPRAAEGRLVIEDVHNFGADYDRTLMAWKANVDAHWDELGDAYDDRFKRMWDWYLLVFGRQLPRPQAAALAVRDVARRRCRRVPRRRHPLIDPPAFICRHLGDPVPSHRRANDGDMSSELEPHSCKITVLAADHPSLEPRARSLLRRPARRAPLLRTVGVRQPQAVPLADRRPRRRRRLPTRRRRDAAGSSASPASTPTARCSSLSSATGAARASGRSSGGPPWNGRARSGYRRIVLRSTRRSRAARRVGEQLGCVVVERSHGRTDMILDPATIRSGRRSA